MNSDAEVRVRKLRGLASLRDAGALTEPEFLAAKANVIRGRACDAEEPSHTHRGRRVRAMLGRRA